MGSLGSLLSARTIVKPCPPRDGCKIPVSVEWFHCISVVQATFRPISLVYAAKKLRPSEQAVNRLVRVLVIQQSIPVAASRRRTPSLTMFCVQAWQTWRIRWTSCGLRPPESVYIFRVANKPTHEEEVTLPFAASPTPRRTRMLFPAFAITPVMMAANLIYIIDGRLVKPRNVICRDEGHFLSARPVGATPVSVNFFVSRRITEINGIVCDVIVEIVAVARKRDRVLAKKAPRILVVIMCSEIVEIRLGVEFATRVLKRVCKRAGRARRLPEGIERVRLGERACAAA